MRRADELRALRDRLCAEWLAAGGDVSEAKRQAELQEQAENHRSDARGLFSWQNHPGMRGGAGHPNRTDEPDLLGLPD